jgi:phage FluMu protein Com
MVYRVATGQENAMGNRLSIKRTLLHAVIAALALSALCGIYVLLSGSLGKTESKILFTTLTISYFSMTSLACAAAYEQKRYLLLAVPGLVLGVMGLLFFVPSIWAEWFEIQTISKAMCIMGVLSFSFAQACFLSLATLQRHQVWVYYAAVVSILGLAAIISGIIVFEPLPREDWIMRFVGAVGILDACFSLCVPILHRLGGKQTSETAHAEYEQIELVCPRCKEHGTYPIGTIKCRKCSLAILIQIGSDSQRPAS